MSESSSFENAEMRQLLARMQAGEEDAFARFWHLHYDRLLRLARRKIGDVPLKEADDEDIAVTALNSFFRGVSEKRFPDVTEGKKLWRLLATIVVNKLSHYRERQMAQKRGGGRVRGESVFLNADRSGDGIDMVPGDEIPPDVAVAFCETSETLFGKLNDDSLRAVARWAFEGCTNAEMATRLNCTTRSVERKLQRIRTIWSKEIEDGT